MLKETLETLEGIVRELTDLNTALDRALIVAITNHQGTITFANNKFCEISKYSRAELLGQNHRIINSGHHSKVFFRDMWRTIANGQIWTGEIKNRAKDGTFYWMHTIIVPLLNSHNKPYQYVSFRNEITVRKLEEENLETLIETLPDLVIFEDSEGRWLKANNAAIKLFQLDEQSYRGLTTAELIKHYPTGASLLQNLHASDDFVWKSGTTSLEELSVPQSTNGCRTIQITKVPVYHKDGQRSGIIVIGKDVTDQRKSEEALRRSETIGVIGQLASGIAHEIRNPLAAIKWSIELLRTQYPDRESQIDMILSELSRVDNIVGELLFIAKPHHRQFGFVNIYDILQSVVTLMTGHAKKNKIAICFDVQESLPLIHCEPHQIKQVFINLIKNALESMTDGGCIVIEAASGLQQDVKVRIKDEGCGIPDELLPRLGEPFISTKERGTGLGLMVSQKIIQDHHGSITFRSNSPHGTVVEVVLHSTEHTTSPLISDDT